MRKIFLVVALVLAGCATHENVWNKQGASRQEFQIDQGQCQAQAFSVPGGGGMQVALVYNSCMRGKGWQLESVPR